MPGASYEVQGTAAQESLVESSLQQGSPFKQQSLFGSYPLSKPHPPLLKAQRWSAVVKKTISVISLSVRDDSKGGSSRNHKLSYTIATQVIVNINTGIGENTVSAVSALVKSQVGFEPILLDSKLFPLIDSDATSGIEFWKSTRRIMAASKSLYDKIGGVNPDIVQCEVDNDTTQTPSSKRSRYATLEV